MRLKLVCRAKVATGESMVRAAHHEARMTPCYANNQSLLNPKTTIEPSAWRHDYFDYWDTAVVAFNVSEPHSALVVTATTELDFTAPELPVGAGLRWDDLADEAFCDQYAEFLQFDDDLVADPGWWAWRDAASGPGEFARQLVSRGLVTSGGEQVVQDALTVLRWAGVPARFVAGYLKPAELMVDQPVEARPYAWLEYWDGAWCAWDPRLDCVPDARHIVIGYARRRDDIPLLCGVQDTEDEATSTVEVSVTRLT